MIKRKRCFSHQSFAVKLLLSPLSNDRCDGWLRVNSADKCSQNKNCHQSIFALDVSMTITILQICLFVQISPILLILQNDPRDNP